MRGKKFLSQNVNTKQTHAKKKKKGGVILTGARSVSFFHTSQLKKHCPEFSSKMKTIRITTPQQLFTTKESIQAESVPEVT